MKTIKTDTSGNIILKNNRVVIIEDKEAMVQECWHRAFLFQGDDIFDKERGLFLPTSLKSSIQTEDVVSEIMEESINTHPDVNSSIVEVEANGDVYNFTVQVDSSYGRIKI